MSEEVDYGWIRISRKMLRSEDPLWGEAREYSRAEAWIDLLGLAAWKPRVMIVKGHTVRLERGDLLGSERFFSERWGWSRSKVRSFLRLLSEEWQRIELKTDHVAAQLGAILSICNYERYQASRTSDVPVIEPVAYQRDTSERPKRSKEEELKKNEKAEEGAPRSAPADAPPASPSVLTFPCIPGKKSAQRVWHLTRSQVEAWESTYPDMDVLAEARKALAHVQANSPKTHDGMPAFLVRWLNRGQNSGRYVRRGGGQVPGGDEVPTAWRDPDAALARLKDSARHCIFEMPYYRDRLLERRMEPNATWESVEAQTSSGAVVRLMSKAVGEEWP